MSLIVKSNSNKSHKVRVIAVGHFVFFIWQRRGQVGSRWPVFVRPLSQEGMTVITPYLVVDCTFVPHATTFLFVNIYFFRSRLLLPICTMCFCISDLCVCVEMCSPGVVSLLPPLRLCCQELAPRSQLGEGTWVDSS